MKRFGAALAIILLFGAAKFRFEGNLADEHRAAYFHGAKLNLGLRQHIGQLGFLAALSGFRSVVADFLWIAAHAAWERTEWGRMALLFNNVTALQPRNVMFWDMAGWHMAWNASVAARENRNQPREALRIKAQKEYFRVGEDFFKRGIANNPDKYVLYDRLGSFYREKYQDHCAASEQYDLAAKFSDAPVFMKRFAVYELAQCPGREIEAYERMLALYEKSESERLPTLITLLAYSSSFVPGKEQEAYRRLRELYDAGEHKRTPILLTRLKAMEEQLSIPPEQRIPISEENK